MIMNRILLINDDVSYLTVSQNMRELIKKGKKE